MTNMEQLFDNAEIPPSTTRGAGRLIVGAVSYWKYDLARWWRLLDGAPGAGTRWSAVRNPDRTWRVVAVNRSGEVPVADGLDEQTARWLVSVPMLSVELLEAVDELLWERDLLRVWLRRADALMAHEADHYLGMTDHDWRVDVAAELDALLHNWGGPER